MNRFNSFLKSNSSITINGKSYVGRNVIIRGDKVIVDGVEQSGELEHGPVTVSITGDVEKCETAAGDITITGNAGQVMTVSGDIRANDITGGAKTVSGDIYAQSVTGGAQTVSGDITGLR